MTVLFASLSVLFGVIADIEVVRDLGIGLAVGAIVGKAVVYRHDRRLGFPMHATTIRRVELLWTLLGGLSGLVIYLISAVL